MFSNLSTKYFSCGSDDDDNVNYNEDIINIYNDNRNDKKKILLS